MTPSSAHRVRRPAVAGTFYPGDPGRLSADVRRYLDGARAPEAGLPPPKAVIAPHAGYPYSGPIAGTAFRALAPVASRLRRIVLLGPSHRVPLRGLGTPGADAFETPLGEFPVDAELVAAAEALPGVAENPRAHAPEHSLEVELPFLQELLRDAPGATLLPLVVGDAGPHDVARVLDAVWGGEETAVVISSDLSHYLPYDEARRRDGATAERILALDPTLGPYDACGAAPINGLLVAAASRGLEPSLLDLRSSGDTAGDHSAVVGYGAFTFRAA